MLTLLGENNAPSVATGLGVGESAAESKFMLIHCTVTTALRLSPGPSVQSVGIVIREHFTTHTTRTDSGQTQQNYSPKDWFHLPNYPYCSWADNCILMSN